MFRGIAFWGQLLVGAVLLCACGDSEKTVSDPKSDSVAQKEQPAAETPLAVAATHAPPAIPKPDARHDRTEVLGFARHIPADAEAILTFHEAAAVADRIRMMKWWQATTANLPKALAPQPKTNGGEFEDLQGILHEEDLAEAAPMISSLETFGKEITIALGKGGTERVAHWVELNRRSTYHQARAVAAQLSSAQANGEYTPMPMFRMLFGTIANPDIYHDLIQDRPAMQALDQFHIPPIYLAVRANKDRIHEVHEVHEVISEPVRSLANFHEIATPIEIVQAGVTFRGYRMVGADLAKSLREGRKYMAEIFGDDMIDRMIEFLTPRELVAVSGIFGDYSVVFLGASIDEFKLAESPEKSITHSDILAFADPQLSHPLHALIYGRRDLLKTLSSSTLADIAPGLRDGFAENDRGGNNRDLVALLQVVSQRERALRALAHHEATGITIVDDDGPRVDIHGGTNGMLDFSTPARLAALADVPDTAIFLNMSTDARYSSRSTAYKEALLETAYALLRRLMEIPEKPKNDDDLGFDPIQFLRPYTANFENHFRGELVGIWQAIAHDMRDGLGRESAVVIDFNGTVPAFPGMPKPLVGKTNSPRVTYIAPVVNRERLAMAWEKIHASAIRITDHIGEVQEREIPMPRPIRSDADSLTSWFLPLPFFDDEFLPSVTLDDAWFSMGTSRNQSINLLRRLESLDARPGGGLFLKVDFRIISNCQRNQIETLMENREAILESDEINAHSFAKKVNQLETLATALEELENLEVRCWEEDGIIRTRIHLRVRKP